MRIKSHSDNAEPKYLAIAGHIRRQIKSGALRRGERISTVAEYCAHFNVSATAVDRALFLLDQEGLITRRNGRGIYVSEVEEIKGTTIACIGFKLNEMRTVPFVSHLLQGVQDAKERHGVDLVVSADTTESTWTKVKGAFIHSDTVEEILASKPSSIPAVAVMITTPNAPGVGLDDFEGARLATNHLIALGHKRIVYLITLESVQNRRRMAGFRSAMVEAGLPVGDENFRAVEYGSTPFLDRGRTVIKHFLDNGWSESGFTAVMAQNDLLAIGAMQAFQDAGLRVPDDVSVIGFDDTEECMLTTPKLSTVRAPLEAIGETAVDLLIRQLTGRPVPMATITFPVSLVERDSTGPPRST